VPSSARTPAAKRPGIDGNEAANVAARAGPGERHDSNSLSTGRGHGNRAESASHAAPEARVSSLEAVWTTPQLGWRDPQIAAGHKVGCSNTIVGLYVKKGALLLTWPPLPHRTGPTSSIRFSGALAFRVELLSRRRIASTLDADVVYGVGGRSHSGALREKRVTLQITSFSPSSGRSGTEVTLNVTGIPPGTEMAQVAVRLGAVNATVINLSPALDRVVVRAPQLPQGGAFHDYFHLHVATEAATSESQFSVTDAVPPVNPSIRSFTPTRPR
jgi:hypothetical protein